MPAVKATPCVARPVLASAVTTLLAFAPMLAIGGIPSKLVWQIPAVVCLALLNRRSVAREIRPQSLTWRRGPWLLALLILLHRRSPA